MNITIFGSGYVGLVTAACLAEVGNQVLCVDIDAERVARLNAGEVPIHEPGLDTLLERNIDSRRLSFTTDAEFAVRHGLFQFIAVGTPADEDGSADLKHVLAVATSIGQSMTETRIVINKSTVPVGTADRVRETIKAQLNRRGQRIEFHVVSNPEFLKEGAAIEDFMKPDRIIVGTDNPRATQLLRTLYAPFNRNRDRLVEMDIRSAELTKYAANSMLATKISFMNELAGLAEALGADIEKVRIGIGSDPRIGYHFIYPGCGFGGSCFPKDITALDRTANSVGYRTELLQAVEAVNRRQKKRLFEKCSQYFNADLAGRTFALWGLAFKPNTDDMREAPSRVLMEALWDAGASVRAFDPAAMGETRRLYPDTEKLELCASADEALSGSDALFVLTEWSVFRSPDFERIRSELKHPVVFDGRNLYDPEYLADLGIHYFGIGRGLSG
ncbi:MAG: UDP-glucose dehydrogenase family protein [Gammaproteobacteria bacterium]